MNVTSFGMAGRVARYAPSDATAKLFRLPWQAVRPVERTIDRATGSGIRIEVLGGTEIRVTGKIADQDGAAVEGAAVHTGGKAEVVC
jgi:hypothetical protein